METVKLTPGTQVQLHFQNRGSERLGAKVIGYLPNNSIIVTAPKAEEKLILLRLDQLVTVRYFHDTTACAFESQIIQICNKPFPYLHLAYPNEIAIDEVRKARRVRTDLACTLSSRGKRFKGTLVDLSARGGKVETDTDLGEPGRVIDMMASIPVAHIKRLLTTPITLRSKNRAGEDGTYSYGVEFSELADDDFILINSYINGQIIEQGFSA